MCHIAIKTISNNSDVFIYFWVEVSKLVEPASDNASFQKQFLLQINFSVCVSVVDFAQVNVNWFVSKEHYFKSSQHVRDQSQPWKHQNIVINLLNVNNRDTRTTTKVSLLLIWEKFHTLLCYFCCRLWARKCRLERYVIG